MVTFSILSVVRSTFRDLLYNSLILIPACAALAAFFYGVNNLSLPSGIGSALGTSYTANLIFSAGVVLLQTVVWWFAFLMVTTFVLRIVQDRSTSLGELFHAVRPIFLRSFITLIGTILFFALATAVSFTLFEELVGSPSGVYGWMLAGCFFAAYAFFVPLFIAYYNLTQYRLLDKHGSIWAAIKQSKHGVQGHYRYVWGTILLSLTIVALNSWLWMDVLTTTMIHNAVVLRVIMHAISIPFLLLINAHLYHSFAIRGHEASLS